jgi:hypothetical protein
MGIRLAVACLCLGPIAAAELQSFHGRAPVCMRSPTLPDFGPPVGCNEDGRPHTRQVFGHVITASTTGTGVLALAFAFVDLDQYQVEQASTVNVDAQAPGSVILKRGMADELTKRKVKTPRRRLVHPQLVKGIVQRLEPGPRDTLP